MGWKIFWLGKKINAPRRDDKKKNEEDKKDLETEEFRATSLARTIQ